MAADGPRTAAAAVVVAAGDGVRLGAGIPKALCLIGGQTLLAHALARFVGHPGIDQVVAVVPGDRLDELRPALPAGVITVAGGTTRHESVAAGLGQLDASIDRVLVHDAARPFVPSEVIDRVLAALEVGADAVIPTVGVTDTIKRVVADAVVETVDRSSLRAVQTPQGFRLSVLLAAHGRSAAGPGTAEVNEPVTDDAALVERAGGRVVWVEGSADAFKITSPHDLRVAEALYGLTAGQEAHR
jgi:2-C-methyl-D-erythritol 4-phosphate cytidylyltransferase